MPNNEKSTIGTEEKRLELSQAGSTWMALKYPKLTVIGVSVIVLVMFIGYLSLR